MEPAQAMRFLSRSAVALALPTGGVVTALLTEPIEEAVFQRVCASVCATNPMPVGVHLGEYVTERYAFTGCSIRLSETREGQGLTKFRRIECV